MASQREKRQKVYDFLRAEIAPKTISEVVDVSVRTVICIQKAIKTGNGIQRKPGSGGEGVKKDFLRGKNRGFL